MTEAVGRIPRPEGRWGSRQKGFSIQEAMGLDGNKAEYNMILATLRQLVCKHLDLHKAFNQQVSGDVDDVVTSINAEHPDLKDKFVDDWPVRALIQQFLTNHKAQHRRRSAKAANDQRLLPAAPVQQPPPPAPLLPGVRKRRLPPAAVRARLPHAPPASFPMPSPLTVFPRFADSPKEHIGTAELMREIHNDGEDLAKATDSNTLICPNMDCVDPIPDLPNAGLTKLLSRRKRIIDQSDTGLGDVLLMNSAICRAIRFQSTLLPLAVSSGWPLRYSPQVLASRIRSLKDQLAAITLHPQASVFWPLIIGNHFGAPMSDLASAFNRNPCAAVLAQIQDTTLLGYYGEQGEMLITSLLAVMFPSYALDSRLFRPLSEEAFMRWIMAPQCAIFLIQEDRQGRAENITQMEAYNILRLSSSYGCYHFRADHMHSRQLDEVLELQHEAFRELCNLRAITATQVLINSQEHARRTAE